MVRCNFCPFLSWIHKVPYCYIDDVILLCRDLEREFNCYLIDETYHIREKALITLIRRGKSLPTAYFEFHSERKEKEKVKFLSLKKGIIDG